MSLKSDDSPSLKHKDLVFILAIAGRIDAQSKLLATEIDKEGSVYKAYAVLDSLSSSYSMFKYFFDACVGGSTDDMHNFMLTPSGIIGITLESIFLVGFSFLAAHFDKEKDGTWKKRLADAWPYFRDVMKGLKNAYKGWRSAVVALNLLHLVDASALILPIGLALGVLAAANRYFMRTITEARKAMMVHNSKLLIELKKLTSLTAADAELYLKNNPIKAQTNRDRYLGYLSASIGGFIDGLYLYVGVLSLAVLVPPLLTALASLCAFYTLACIITRLYEERDFQMRLMVTQTKCNLVILTKRIQTHYAQLLLLDETQEKTEDIILQMDDLKADLSKLIAQFEKNRNLLRHQTSRSYVSAFLLGMRNGLYAYGALSSVLFLVSTFLVLGGVSFPPAVIAVAVCLGLALMAGFIIHALVENYQHKQKEKPAEEAMYKELLAMQTRFEKKEDQKQDAALLTQERIDESLKEGLLVKPAPTHFFQEWFEVFRSLFSGLGKGQKFAEFAGNPLQEAGGDGHYHDTPVMFVLGALSSLLFGVILALRALARGIGRAPLGASNDLTSAVIDSSKSTIIESNALPTVHPDPTKTEVSGESIQASKRNDSPKNSESFLSMVGFFKPKIPRPKSEQALNQIIDQSNTVVGLN